MKQLEESLKLSHNEERLDKNDLKTYIITMNRNISTINQIQRSNLLEKVKYYY